MSVFYPLFSSSSGNCTYIGTEAGGILVDAGASAKGIKTALQQVDADFSHIRAVLITHTHSDHTKGLKAVLNQTGAELLASQASLDYLIAKDMVPAFTCVSEITENAPAKLDGVQMNCFCTMHDCEGSYGYFFLLPDGKKISICTDLGGVTPGVHAALTGSDLVLLESNHDVEMLKKGPYPPMLKMRILSDIGHLSNPGCAAEIRRLFETGTERFILGHLSQHNNTPELALTTSESALLDLDAVNGKDYLLRVAAPQNNRVTII